MIATMKTRTDFAVAKKRNEPTTPEEAIPRRKLPSDNRIQSLKVADIQSCVGDARHWLAAIDTILKDCRDNQIVEITVDGATKLERAVELLTTFSSYAFRGANRALSEKRRNQGRGSTPDLPTTPTDTK